MTATALFLAPGLLLLGAAAGWLAGRRLRGGTVPPAVPDLYVQGLNHLLGERNDEAIQTFLAALRRHPESLDILLALGRLFRRRGELERALTVHQYLLEQPDLTAETRQAVLLEIARDYLKSGILNRAESILRELLQRSPGDREGLEALAELYELGGDWEQAIGVRRALAREGGGEQRKTVALLYGELAGAAIGKGDLAGAERFMADALAEDARCFRIPVLRGHLAYRREEWRQAAEAWAGLLRDESVGVLLLVLEPFLEALQHCTGDPRCRVWRDLLLQYGSGPQAIGRLMDAMEKVEGRAAVAAYLERLLRERPELPVLQLFVRAGGEPGAVPAPVAETIRRLPLAVPPLACHSCGYQTGEFYWRCPSCRNWGTFVDGGIRA